MITQRQWLPYFNEYLVTFSITLSMMAGGTHFGWSSPSIPKLLKENIITRDDASWIISFLSLGAIAGPIPAGFLANRIGRKLTLILTAVPYIASWVIILLAEAAWVIFIGRFIAGMAYGATFAVAPMYLGEIASNRIRGALTILKFSMLSMGSTLSFSIGPYVSYGTLPYILMVIPIILLFSYFWIPETPYYYIMKGREKDAFNSLKYLRKDKNDEDLKTEFNLIKTFVERNQQNKGTVKELLQTRGNRIALIIMLICGAAMHLSGGKTIKSYAEIIFSESGTILTASESVIVIGCTELAMSLVASFTVDKVGRRSLMFISLTGVITTNVILGVNFFLKDQHVDVSGFAWLPLVTIMLFKISDTLGVAALHHTLLGELFPTNVKALAACIVTMFANTVGFVIHKLYQVVSDDLGNYVPHWFYAVCSLMNLITFYFMLPETRNISFAEIQSILNERKKL